MTLPPSDHPIQRDVQKYRNIADPYCEKGLISVLFLSCGRHIITKNCLEALLQSLDVYISNDNVEFIFLEQSEDYSEANKNLLLYDSFRFNRKIVVYSRTNYGIANANNQLWQLSRGEYCLFLENDWFTEQTDADWLYDAKSILDSYDDVGVIQLRAINDPWENWGFGKNEYNPFSIKDNKHVVYMETDNMHSFAVAQHRFYGYNNNPALIRKKMKRELGIAKEPEIWSDLKHDEHDLGQKFYDSDWKAAHIITPVFYHAGNDVYKRMWDA